MPASISNSTCTLLVALAALLLSCAPLLAHDQSNDLDEPPVTEDDRDHWSFLPLARPPVPAVENTAWPANPLDHFILANLEDSSLAPAPPADRATLLRRVTFDLTGLPPTPAELRAFLADENPDAYLRVVDRLLASPAYGERYAQYWLDLARYADTDGFEHDKVRPTAWKYRDWVIRALDADLPYDRFVQLQLAGDELHPNDPAAHTATGFVLSGPDMPDINLQTERSHNVLNEVTGTIGSVFLGLQLGCAACHDHKYDPLSQADFYRLRAIFEPAIQFKKSSHTPRTLAETSSVAPVSHLLHRGDFQSPGPVLEPAFPRIANPAGHAIPAPEETQTTTGRRTALASWLTAPDNPLTLRVLANRIWGWHFGRGLSHTPSDFGLMGHEPTHPELLDWLATELPRHDFHLKPIHRLIVTSATYRQASRLNSEQRDDETLADAWQRALRIDPDNEYLARFPRRRLDGEALRDSILAVTGTLNRRRTGPGVMAPLPPELESALIKGHWKTDPDPAEHTRRSIYLFARRNLRYPLFDAFDRPDANTSCPSRQTTTTAPQSLALLNSDLTRRAAERLAADLLAATDDDASESHSRESECIDRLYLLAFGRSPTPDETARALDFLASQATAQSDAARARAFTDLCLAIFNFNEFLYID